MGELHMYCNMCGTKAVQGARFCANCGAACAQQQQCQVPQYQPPPLEHGQKPYANLSDLWAWLIAFSPAIISLIWLVYLLFAPGSYYWDWLILMVIGSPVMLVFVLLDNKELQRNGVNNRAWSWWSWNWRPYLYSRAKFTNQNYAPVVVYFIMLFVSGIFDIWMFIHFGLW